MTKYLTARQVADLTSLSIQTLANWRTAGQGPPWTKCERAVRYPEDALRRWLDARTTPASGEAAA
jgi:predicted DNA-binding transcriptional regulator AlpA